MADVQQLVKVLEEKQQWMNHMQLGQAVGFGDLRRDEQVALRALAAFDLIQVRERRVPQIMYEYAALGVADDEVA